MSFITSWMKRKTFGQELKYFIKQISPSTASQTLGCKRRRWRRKFVGLISLLSFWQWLHLLPSLTSPPDTVYLYLVNSSWTKVWFALSFFAGSLPPTVSDSVSVSSACLLDGLVDGPELESSMTEQNVWKLFWRYMFSNNTMWLIHCKRTLYGDFKTIRTLKTFQIEQWLYVFSVQTHAESLETAVRSEYILS